MSLAWIGLGANLGDARQTLLSAWEALGDTPGVQLQALSPMYRTAPMQATGPDFINAVGRLRTSLTPLALLDALLAIETRFGRERPHWHAPRTLDLDLLLMDDVQQSSPRLTLPHPRLHERAFVLRPLADVSPDLVLAQGTLQTLLATVADQRIDPL